MSSNFGEISPDQKIDARGSLLLSAVYTEPAEFYWRPYVSIKQKYRTPDRNAATFAWLCQRKQK